MLYQRFEKQLGYIHPEGVNAYNVTIWDANVQARGRMTTLSELFNDLEELVSQYIKEK